MLRRNITEVFDDVLDADLVIRRLEEAGQALLSLPHTGPSTRLVQSGLEWIRDASDQGGHERARMRPAIPDAATITRMDQALAWILFIPVDKYVLRRVVGARSLVNPLTGRHLYTWRRLAVAVGADHKAVQRWHGQGIDLIVGRLRGMPAAGAAAKRPSAAVRSAARPRSAATVPS